MRRRGAAIAVGPTGAILLGSAKLGRRPARVRGDATPTCRTCAATMRFAAQLPELHDTWNFGGDGLAYVFVCPDDHEGRMRWQCG